MHEVFLTEQPWVCMTCPVSDDEADANGGKTHCVFDCCVCGATERFDYILPPASDPCWKEGKPLASCGSA